MYARLRGLPPHRIERLATRLLRRLSLSEFADRCADVRSVDAVTSSQWMRHDAQVDVLRCIRCRLDFETSRLALCGMIGRDEGFVTGFEMSLALCDVKQSGWQVIGAWA